jgi:hypothetical protein
MINPNSEPVQSYLIVNHRNTAYEKISAKTYYKNVGEMREWNYYRIDVSDIETLESLTVNLVTFQGDADLYIHASETAPTQTSYMWSSQRQGTLLDQVILS